MSNEHIPTHESIQKVKELVAYTKYTHDQIAEYLDISKPTLYKYYTEQLKRSRADKVCKAGNLIVGQLDSDNEKLAQKAAMFILRTLGGWGDKEETQGENLEMVMGELKEQIDKIRRDNEREF